MLRSRSSRRLASEPAVRVDDARSAGTPDRVRRALDGRQGASGADTTCDEIGRPPRTGSPSPIPILRADEVWCLRRRIHHVGKEPPWVLRRQDQGRCDNHLTIRREGVAARVLTALQDKLLRQDLFEEFCDEFTREMNRLRMEHRASLSAAEREIDRIEARRKKLIEMVMEGVPPSEVKDELTANAARREDLKARLAAADAPPPLLHPEMAELYRQKVTTLAQALDQQETRVETTDALRGLIDAIILTPADGELRIELKGNLAAMLSAATNAKRSPETGDLSLQVVVVAGAGFEPATFGL
jgi:hypothetical protein